MRFLIKILIYDFIVLVNYVATENTNPYYSLYLMMAEGFYAEDGQANWELVRDNPDKKYEYQESEEYAKELKELDEKAYKVGARFWAIQKNINLDTYFLATIHQFGEDGDLNRRHVFYYWYETDGRGNHLRWDSWVGREYGNYLRYTEFKGPHEVMGVSAWINKKYEPMIQYFTPF